jgi:hypothetical protein
MRSTLLLGLALAALSTGCAMSIPETAPYPRAVAPAEPPPGATFCSRTETAARSLSSSQYAGGWVFASLGVASTGAGAIATLVNTEEGRRIAGTALTVGGVALGAVAYTLFMRSQASGRLAHAANAAILERDDHAAWEACVRAKAAWSSAKSSPDAVTTEMLLLRDRENQRLRDEIEELRKKALEQGPKR